MRQKVALYSGCNCKAKAIGCCLSFTVSKLLNKQIAKQKAQTSFLFRLCYLMEYCIKAWPMSFSVQNYGSYHYKSP